MKQTIIISMLLLISESSFKNRSFIPPKIFSRISDI